MNVLTGLVVIVKLFALLLAATTTLAGTRAAGSLLERKTVVPPVGAGVASPTVPCRDAPPITDTASSPIA
ncbi:MAG: hypothetical protein DMG03_01405 [Acidobacteria bacterium]|nr:MAG: hypothetical protein DMG03_01405 [Acidobacteriota bacterium]